MTKTLRKQRGIFELPARSGIWWICYLDQFGRTAKKRNCCIPKKKDRVREGRFFPKTTKSEVLFDEIGKDALNY